MHYLALNCFKFWLLVAPKKLWFGHASIFSFFRYQLALEKTWGGGGRGEGGVLKRGGRICTPRNMGEDREEEEGGGRVTAGSISITGQQPKTANLGQKGGMKLFLHFWVDEGGKGKFLFSIFAFPSSCFGGLVVTVAKCRRYSQFWITGMSQ